MHSYSKVEWEFVANPDMDKTYAERGDREANSAPERSLRRSRPEWCHKPLTLKALETLKDEKNAELVAKECARLETLEVIGGRLYTGPMFTKYNNVLRAHSGVPIFRVWNEEYNCGNTYATTIHAINSCIIKLSRLQKVCKVWRGMSNMALPDKFMHPDDLGISGGVEFGFSSTTAQKEQAVHYSRGNASTVFEMEMGMVDKGADVSWLSQV